MLRAIREKQGLTAEEMGNIVGVGAHAVLRWETYGVKTSEVLTRYINHVDMDDTDRYMLKAFRRDNWLYDESKSPIENDLTRISNGLGVSERSLSLKLEQQPGYWSQLKHNSRGLSANDFALLDKYFNISTTTIIRHNTIVDKVRRGEALSEDCKWFNTEIQEPVELYDDSEREVDPELYLPLVQEIERKYGSVSDAPDSDPALIRLRMMMGVKYYDKEGRCLTS